MDAKHGVLTLGDAMITLNPAQSGPLRFVSSFERKVGGAELNFAVGCARLGLRSKWISRLGKDEFGHVIYNFARGEGIDVTDVAFAEGYTTSLNFKEIREDGSGKTFYYRFQSPILSLEPQDITQKMLDGVELVHLTGVFLAIDPKNIEIVKRVLELAKEAGIPVSFDPNLRLKLWTIEAARTAFLNIFPYIDLLLSGREEIEMIIGTSSEEALEQFAEQYGIGQLVIKNGAAGSKLLEKGIWYRKEAFKVTPVDTVGAGDGFDAGYIYAFLTQLPAEQRLAYANGVGALVTTVSGDNEGLPYLEELLAFVNDELVIER